MTNRLLGRRLTFGDAEQIAEIKRLESVRDAENRVRTALDDIHDAIENYCEIIGCDDWLRSHIKLAVEEMRNMVGLDLIEELKREKMRPVVTIDHETIAKLISR